MVQASTGVLRRGEGVPKKYRGVLWCIRCDGDVDVLWQATCWAE